MTVCCLVFLFRSHVRQEYNKEEKSAFTFLHKVPP